MDHTNNDSRHGLVAAPQTINQELGWGIPQNVLTDLGFGHKTSEKGRSQLHQTLPSVRQAVLRSIGYMPAASEDLAQLGGLPKPISGFPRFEAGETPLGSWFKGEPPPWLGFSVLSRRLAACNVLLIACSPKPTPGLLEVKLSGTPIQRPSSPLERNIGSFKPLRNLGGCWAGLFGDRAEVRGDLPRSSTNSRKTSSSTWVGAPTWGSEGNIRIAESDKLLAGVVF